MQEYELTQDIAAQIARLPPEKIEEVRQYIQELGQAEAQYREQQHKYLTFLCCGQMFGVHIRQVIQILQITQITALPDSPPYMLGVLALRDEMVPVLDLRIRLGRGSAEDMEQGCIIIMSVQGHSFGAVVDRVCNVETFLPEEICAPPRRDERKENYLCGIGKRDRVILLVDADHLFTDADLEQILDVSSESALPV